MTEACKKAKAEYKKLGSIFQEFILFLSSQDIEQAKKLKVKIRRKIEKINNIIDPEQERLRARLAEDLSVEFVGMFKEGLAAVKEWGNKGWFFIDIDGNEVISGRFDDVEYFTSEGVARVNKNGKWFHIDKEGDKVFKI